MTEAFVDTNFWIAYLDRSDQYHSAAAALFVPLSSSHRLVTTNFVAMQDRVIQVALGFDDHFKKMGFQLLSAI